MKPRHQNTLVLALLSLSALLICACDPRTTTPPLAPQTTSPQTATPPKADIPRTLEDIPRTLEDLPDGLNIVQFEMQLLTRVMQDTLLHIANADLQKIPAEISAVHPIYELKSSALEQGAYQPPLNSENLPGFSSLSDAFHEDLFLLGVAAQANDLPATTAAYTRLVQACTRCHTEFRFPRP